MVMMYSKHYFLLGGRRRAIQISCMLVICNNASIYLIQFVSHL